MKINNLVRCVILLAVFFLFFNGSRGYGDISAIIILYFISEYLFLFTKKRKPLLGDSNKGLSFFKKIFSAVFPSFILWGVYYLINFVSPNPSNIIPTTTMSFVFIFVFMGLFLDIKSRQGTLSKATYKGSLIGIILLLLTYLGILFNIIPA